MRAVIAPEYYLLSHFAARALGAALPLS